MKETTILRRQLRSTLSELRDAENLIPDELADDERLGPFLLRLAEAQVDIGLALDEAEGKA